MHIKNNVFVKITAVLFMVMMTGILYASVYNHFLEQADGGFVLGIYAGGLLLLLLIVMLMIKLAALKEQETHSVFLIFEILAASFLIIHGIILRTMPEIVFNSQNTAYFDISVSLQKGMMMPNKDVVVQSVMDMPSLFGYGKLVSCGFALFGTKPEVLFYSNLIFQMLSVIFLYRIVRRLAGKVCGIIALAMAVYMPSQIFSTYTLNSEALFSCLLFGALWLFLYLADRYEKREFDLQGVLLQILEGMLFGITIFIEPVSIILILVVLLLQFFCKKKCVLRGCLTFFMTVAVFALLVLWMSQSLQIDYLQSVGAYAEEFVPEIETLQGTNPRHQTTRVMEQFSLTLSEQGNDITENYESLLYKDGKRLTTSFAGLMQVLNHFLYLWTVVLSLLFGLYVLIGRNLHRKDRKAILFMWLTMGSLVMLFLHMNRLYNTAFYICLLIIVSSTAFRYIYLAFLSPSQVMAEPEELPEETEPEPLHIYAAQEEKPQVIEEPLPEAQIVEERLPEPQSVEEPLPEPQSIEPKRMKQQAEEIKMEEPKIEELQTEAPKVKFIENPLPLPKRHVKRNRIDYSVEVPEEQMQYDVAVSEDDDWDH